MGEPFTELAFANAVTRWQQDEAVNAAALDVATRYAAWAAHTPEGRAAHRSGLLFRAPRKLDHLQLVPLEAAQVNGVTAWKHPGDHLRRREGFALTDPGMDLPAALGEAHYCIWCHEQGKDSCARGLPEKKPADGERAGDPVPPKPVRRRAGGLPPGREDLGVPEAPRRRAGRSARSRSCASTIRWSPARVTGSATTA